MTAEAPSRPPWLAQTVRFAAFPANALDISQCTDWWQRIVGSAPETLTLHQGSTLQATGPYGGGLLTLLVGTIGETRVDLIFSPIIPTEGPLPPAPTLGPLEEIMPAMGEAFSKWAEIKVPSRRIGLSGAFIQAVPDHVTGYRVLSNFLPAIKLDADGSSDFVYQINRPVKSRNAEIVLNRISRWTLTLQQPFQVAISVASAGGAPLTQAVPTAQSAHFVRVDIDANTDANYRTEFSNDLMNSLFRELFDVCHRLAIEGDRP